MKQTVTPTTHQLFLRGAIDALPLVLAAAPVAVIFAVLALGNGFSAWATQGMSLFVFAGSAQFIAAGLAGSEASIGIIILTVAVVNLRHALYATHLMQQVHVVPQAARIPLAFVLTDEAFATTVTQMGRLSPRNLFSYYAGAALCLYVLWQLATLIGIVAGQSFPDLTQYGLEVAMAVAFAGVVIGSVKNNAGVLCMLSAGFTMALTYHWPHQLGLLASACVGITAGMCIQRGQANE